MVTEAESTIILSGVLAEADHRDESALLPLPVELRRNVSNGALVEGTLNGFPFRSPVEVGEEDIPCLRISKALLSAFKAKPGDTLTGEITRVGDEPEVRVPADLVKALDSTPKAAALWPKITPMARREWVRWIASAKQQETRERRIEVGMDKLTKGMRRPCCFPGLNFVTKDLVPPEDTWAPLPDKKS